ncbi:hypothetical protein GEMRC1_006874 [Eukaryota sp. GEM-RC1]
MRLLLFLSVCCCLALANPILFLQNDDNVNVYDFGGDFVKLPVDPSSLTSSTYTIIEGDLYILNKLSSSLRLYGSTDSYSSWIHNEISYTLVAACYPLAIVRESDCVSSCPYYAIAFNNFVIEDIVQLDLPNQPSVCAASRVPQRSAWTSGVLRTSWALATSGPDLSHTYIYILDKVRSSGAFVIDTTRSQHHTNSICTLGMTLFFRDSEVFVFCSTSSSIQILHLSSGIRINDVTLSTSPIGIGCNITEDLDSHTCFYAIPGTSSTCIFSLETESYSEPVEVLEVDTVYSFFAYFEAASYKKVWPHSVHFPTEVVWYTGSMVNGVTVYFTVLSPDTADVPLVLEPIVVEGNNITLPGAEVFGESFLAANVIASVFSVPTPQGGYLNITGPDLVIAPYVSHLEGHKDHHTFGNTLIHIHGENFRDPIPDDPIYLFVAGFLDGLRDCSFTRSISSTTISCTVPEGYGSWPVGVRIGDAVSNVTEDRMTYSPPLVSSFSPTTSSTSGGVYVDIYGLNFGPSSAPRSGFLGPFECDSLRYVSHTRLQCLVGLGVGKDHFVKVIVGGQPSTYSMQDDVFFDFSPPDIIVTSRNVLNFHGGSVITIQGSNFGHLQDNISAIIGDDFPCTDVVLRHLHWSFECVASAGSGVGLGVTVFVGGQMATFDSNLRYQRPVIYDITPNTGTYNPGMTATITGRYLGHSFSSVLVTFNDVFATIVHSTDASVQIDVPVLAAADIVVLVDVDQQRSNRNVTFTTYEPVIERIEPSVIPTFGQNVSFIGYNLWGNPVVLTVEGVELTAHSIEFVTEGDAELEVVTFDVIPGVGANLDLSLLISNREADLEVLSLSYEKPVITNVFPLNGSADEVVITLEGLNFGVEIPDVNSMDFVSVKIGSFGSCETVAFVDDAIVCNYKQGGGHSLDITVTVKGQQSDPFNQKFDFDPPVVTSVQPTTFATSGTQQITLFGINFGDLSTAITINLHHATRDTIPCINPRRWNLIEVTCFFNPFVGTDFYPIISVEGQSNSESMELNPIYLRSLRPIVSSIFPGTGSPGKVSLVLTGSNFGRQKHLVTVTIGQFSCTVTSVSNREIQCDLKTGHGASLIVDVVVAGQNADFPRQLTFTFEMPTITSVFPLLLPTTDAELTLTGAGFGQDSSLIEIELHGYDSRSRFFKVDCGKVVITSISDEEAIRCTIQSGIGYDLIPSINFNGLSPVVSSNLTVSFESPTFVSLNPSSLSSSGGDILTVTGTNFSPGFEHFYSCYFGNIPGIEILINSTVQLSITTPALLGTFEVSFNIFRQPYSFSSLASVTYTLPTDTTASPLNSNDGTIPQLPFGSTLVISGTGLPLKDYDVFGYSSSFLSVSLTSDVLTLPCVNPHYDLEEILFGSFSFDTAIPVSSPGLFFSTPSVNGSSIYAPSSWVYIYGTSFGPFSTNVSVDDEFGYEVCQHSFVLSDTVIACFSKDQVFNVTFEISLTLNGVLVEGTLIMELAPLNDDYTVTGHLFSLMSSSPVIDNSDDVMCTFESVSTLDTFTSDSCFIPTNITTGVYRVKIDQSFISLIGIYDPFQFTTEPQFISNQGGYLFVKIPGLVLPSYSPSPYFEANLSSDDGDLILTARLVSHELLLIDFDPYDYESLSNPVVSIDFDSDDFVFDLPVFSINSVSPASLSKVNDSIVSVDVGLEFDFEPSVIEHLLPINYGSRLSIDCGDFTKSINLPLLLSGDDFDFSVDIPSFNWLSRICSGPSVSFSSFNPMPSLFLTVSDVHVDIPVTDLEYFSLVSYTPHRFRSTGGMVLEVVASDLVFPSDHSCVGSITVDCPHIFFGDSIPVPMSSLPTSMDNQTVLEFVVPPLVELFPSAEIPMVFAGFLSFPVRLSFDLSGISYFEFDEYSEFFSYFNITSVHPLGSSILGGTEVVFSGESVGSIASNIHSIRLSPLVEIFEIFTIDSNSFYIVTPPSLTVSEPFPVTIQLNEIISLDFDFQYFNYSTFDFYPKSSRVDAAELISIDGENFPDLGPGHLICKFGPNKPVPGSYHNSSLVFCRLPESTIVELDVGLEISFDDGDTFSFVGDFFIHPSGAEDCRPNISKITVNDFSDPLSTGSFEFIQKRAFRVIHNLPNLAKSAPVEPINDIDLDSAAIANFSSLTDGDRCCLKTHYTLGKCGVEFTHPDYTEVIVKLPRPAFINNVVTVWNDPCSCQPVTFTIDSKLTSSFIDGSTEGYDSPDNDQDWHHDRIHYTGRGSLPAYMDFTNPRVCPHIVGDSNDVAICMDPFREILKTDQLKIRWDNRLESRARGWLMEVEAEGMFMDMPWSLDSNVTSITIDTDLNVYIPSIKIDTFNYEGYVLEGFESSFDTICVTLKDSSGYDVTYLIVSETCIVTSRAVAVFDNIILKAPAHGNYVFHFASETIYNSVSVDLEIVFGPPRYLEVAFPTYLIQIHNNFTVRMENAVEITFFDASRVQVPTLKADFDLIVPEISYLEVNITDPHYVNSTHWYMMRNINVPHQDDLFSVFWAVSSFELYTPLVGIYQVEFLSSATESTYLNVEVLPGAPDHLTAEIFEIISNNVPLQNFISIAVRDFLENIIYDPIEIRLTAENRNGSHISLSNSTDSTSDGFATFNNIVITTMPASFVDLFFSASDPLTGRSITPTSLTEVFVRRCPTYMTGVCVGSQCDCQCVAGAFHVDSAREILTGSQCQPCFRGFFKDFIGPDACTSCPPALTTRDEGSVSIDDCYCPGTQYLQVEYDCKPCPNGLKCFEGRPNGTEPGFWASSFNSSNAYICTTPYCLGRHNPFQTNDEVCDNGHTGPLCTICDDGYTLMGNECAKCNDSAILDVFIVIFLVFIIFGYIIILIRGSKNPRSTQSLFLRILTNHTQVLSSIGDFGVRWPGLLRSIFGVAGSSGWSIGSKSFGLHLCHVIYRTVIHLLWITIVYVCCSFLLLLFQINC